MKINYKQNNYKKIHFIGIAGSAMGSVAAMIKEAGFSVQGSDSELYPPMSDCLAKSGIKVFTGFARENITDDVDLVVVGNAISRGNPELEHTLDKRIRYTSFPDALREFFIRGAVSIVVTGTHGKTTTSSLISWILHSMGKDTGFLIGGISHNFGKGFACPKRTGGYFVTEGDEYDTAFFDKRSKFLHYLPDLVIINNLEYDHADIFDSLADIKRSFGHLIRIVPANGFIVTNADDENVCDVTKEFYCKKVTFSVRGAAADYIAADVHYGDGSTKFDIVKGGRVITKIDTSLSGGHNVSNILASVAALDSLGMDIGGVTAGVSGFKGIKRRMERVGEVRGITVYDDFAHHPSAIRETIMGVRRGRPGKRVIALFEPKSNTSRRNVFQDDFTGALGAADVVIIGKVYNYEKMSEGERLDPYKLVKSIISVGADAHYIPDIDELSRFTAAIARAGDIIIAMSSGSFYGVHKKILDELAHTT